MANHKSTKKDSRQNNKRRIHNKYYKKTMRNAVKDLRKSEEPSPSQESVSSVMSMIDKLAKRKVIHKNKAGNLKRKLARLLNLKKKNAVVAPAPTPAAE